MVARKGSIIEVLVAGNSTGVNNKPYPLLYRLVVINGRILPKTVIFSGSTVDATLS